MVLTLDEIRNQREVSSESAELTSGRPLARGWKSARNSSAVNFSGMNVITSFCEVQARMRPASSVGFHGRRR